MSGYLPIADHGLIGDLHSVALVGTDGTIDWYCCPRFDSPSVFASIRGLQAPVYFALGGLSNPDHYAKIAERLAGVLPDFTLEVFEQCHHFEPPHRVEPERLASSLRGLSARGETVSIAG